MIAPTAALVDASRADIADRFDIEALVRAFYRAAAMDDLLGPIFAASRIDWSIHLLKLADFWSLQLLGERGYEGHPLRAHEPVHQRTPFEQRHYDRWVLLFTETVDELFDGPTAEVAKSRARKMAAALQRLMEGESAAGDVPIVATLTRP